MSDDCDKILLDLDNLELADIHLMLKKNGLSLDSDKIDLIHRLKKFFGFASQNSNVGVEGTGMY